MAISLGAAAQSSSQSSSSQSSQGQSSPAKTAPGQSAQPESEQTSPDSDGLAAAARDAKVQKAAHAKKVFTDEDMEVIAGPLPRLKMDGAENADEVVTAIAQFKAAHTPEQTEQAVHTWYDRYDQMLAAAIQENIDMQSLRNANTSNGYDLCQESQDYQKCQSRQMAEMRSARSDSVEMMKNSNLEVRLQHAFMKVRNGLMQNHLNYDWFKIRTTNGIDLY
jgi:hypothetical protein